MLYSSASTQPWYACSQHMCMCTHARARTHTPFFSTSTCMRLSAWDCCRFLVMHQLWSTSKQCLLGRNFKLRMFGVGNIWHKTFSLSDIILLETQLSGLKNPFRSLWSRAYFFSSGNSTAELLKISRNLFAVLRWQFLSLLVRDGYTQVNLSPSLVHKKRWGEQAHCTSFPKCLWGVASWCAYCCRWY